MVCHVCGTLVNLVNRGRYLKSSWKVTEKYLKSTCKRGGDQRTTNENLLQHWHGKTSHTIGKVIEMDIEIYMDLKSTWKVPEKYLESCNTKIKTKDEWNVMGNIWAGLYNTKNHLTTVAVVAIATRTSANIITSFTTLNIITPASPGWALFCLALASCLYCPPIGFKIYPSRFTNLEKCHDHMKIFFLD